MLFGYMKRFKDDPLHVLACTICGYERSTDDDGRQFTEDEHDNLICSECWQDEPS